MKTAALATTLLAAGASAHDFTTCADPDYLGITSVDCPDPVAPGGDLAISFSGVAGEDITTATGTLKVKVLGITIDTATYDVCKDTGVTCPIAKGDSYSGSIHYTTPSAAPAGATATGEFSVTSGSDTVGCISVDVKVGSTLEAEEPVVASYQAVLSPIAGASVDGVTGYAYFEAPQADGLLVGHALAHGLEAGISADGGDCTATNGCGLHIHAGTACDDSDTQGGHYFGGDVAEDPWALLGYTETDADGESGVVDLKLDIGTEGVDLAGKPFIVHANDGSRVACGILEPTFLSAAAVTNSHCPGSPAAITHAKCDMSLAFTDSCAAVAAEATARVNGQYAQWHDPHNNGTYAIKSSSASEIALERLTGNGKYTDKIILSLTEEGNGGCSVAACSESQVTSVVDYSTNYCNIHSLFCADDGCRPIGDGLTFTETFNDCSQHDDVCLAV